MGIGVLGMANTRVGIVYPPQDTRLSVSSKLLQFYKPDVLQEWIDYFSDAYMTLLDPVRCVFSRTDEFCDWDVGCQHLVMLVLMTSISFAVRNWHNLLIQEATEKLKNYGVYKVRRVCWDV